MIRATRAEKHGFTDTQISALSAMGQHIMSTAQGHANTANKDEEYQQGINLFPMTANEATRNTQKPAIFNRLTPKENEFVDLIGLNQ